MSVLFQFALLREDEVSTEKLSKTYYPDGTSSEWVDTSKRVTATAKKNARRALRRGAHPGSQAAHQAKVAADAAKTAAAAAPTAAGAPAAAAAKKAATAGAKQTGAAGAPAKLGLFRKAGGLVKGHKTAALVTGGVLAAGTGAALYGRHRRKKAAAADAGGAE